MVDEYFRLYTHYTAHHLSFPITSHPASLHSKPPRILLSRLPSRLKCSIRQSPQTLRRTLSRRNPRDVVPQLFHKSRRLVVERILKADLCRH